MNSRLVALLAAMILGCGSLNHWMSSNETKAMADLEAFARANEKFAQETNNGAYAAPGELVQETPSAPAGLPRRFLQSVRSGYRFEFSGQRVESFAEGWYPVQPSFRTFLYKASPRLRRVSGRKFFVIDSQDPKARALPEAAWTKATFPAASLQEIPGGQSSSYNDELARLSAFAQDAPVLPDPAIMQKQQSIKAYQNAWAEVRRKEAAKEAAARRPPPEPPKPSAEDIANTRRVVEEIQWQRWRDRNGLPPR
jgi:hypothetical protein